MTTPDLWMMAFAVAVIFIAAIVRGFSGFGFSLIAITALSFVFAPVEVIGAVFLMELAASLHLLPSVWRQIDWRSVGLLLLGTVLATPLGVTALAQVPAPPMKLGLAILVLTTVTLLLMGFALKRTPGRAMTAATGALCGLLNGAFGIGGPPAILFFFSTPAGAAAGRASLIAFFFGADLIGLASQFHQGLLSVDHAIKAAVFLPPLLIGIALGSRGFRSIDPDRFRRAVLWLLAAMAVAIGAMAILEMAGIATSAPV